jgi:hypothetical protein
MRSPGSRQSRTDSPTGCDYIVYGYHVLAITKLARREFPAMKIIITDSEGATTSGQVSRQTAPSVAQVNQAVNGLQQ